MNNQSTQIKSGRILWALGILVLALAGSAGSSLLRQTLLPDVHAAATAADDRPVYSILPDDTNAAPRAPSVSHPPKTLAPGPDAPNIARITANLLINSHFSQKSFDDDTSSRLLDEFLDNLDSARLVFLQSDVREFERFRHNLDDLILKTGDTRPAYFIFKRFLQRLEAQVEFIHAALATNQFDFQSHRTYTYNRRDQARPRDLDEARQFWYDRLCFEYLQEKLNQDKKEEIVKVIQRRYDRILRFLKEYESDDVLELYLTSLAHVYDPHSDYMGRAQFDNFNIQMRLSLFGIGAVLRSEDGYCKIQELIPGGPAEKSKRLKPNDRIIAVAQADGEMVDVVDLKLDKVVQLIRGPKGTEVRLTVIPADAVDSAVRRQVVLIRDEVKLEEKEAKAKVLDVPGEKPLRLGVIDLPSFYSEMPSSGRLKELKSTTTDVARLIKKLKQEKVDGLILDLRRNGGGSLEEAINLTGLFIEEGAVVQVKDPYGTVGLHEDTDDTMLYDGPLIVLTSRLSASASEILAGALQDYGRAVIVGESSTHGKGTVQKLMQLEPFFQRLGLKSQANPGALKLTIQKYYRPSGASTQLKGVIPDIVLPALNNHAEIGENSLSNALSWDAIAKATFKPDHRVRPALPELQARSARRVTQDRDFNYVREEIERYRKVIQEKSVSLNEAKRRQEKAEAEARAKARKEELRQRPPSTEKAYEITLKLVDLPGLPPPMTNATLSAASKSSAPKSVDAEGLASADREPSAEGKETGETDKTADDDVPTPDFVLQEAERILADLVELSAAKPAVAAKR